MVDNVTDGAQRYLTLDAKQAARVAKAINDRLAQMPGMNQSRLSKQSGVSEATVRPLMRAVARQYWPDKLRSVSAALGWTTDSLERVMLGGEPLVLEQDTPTPSDDGRFDAMEKRLAHLETQVASVTASVDEIRGLVRGLAEDPRVP